MKLKDFIKKWTGHLTQDKISLETKKFRHKIFSQNSETIEWLSSPLSGVHVIIWTDKNEADFFSSLKINHNGFVRDIPKIDDINMDFKVSSNPVYLLCAILIHHVIGYKKEDEVIDNIYLLMSFRIVTSAYSQYYRYPVDEFTARRVFDKLSKKHLIKKYGSNYKVLLHKAQYVHKGTDNYNHFKSNDMERFILGINSISNSVRQYIHTNFLVLLETLEEDNSSELSIYNEDGKMLKISNNNKVYYENIEKILINKHMLVDRKVLELLGEVLDTDIELMEKVLNSIHDEFMDNPSEVLALVDNIVNATLYYLYKNEFYPPYDQSIPVLIEYLKSYWGNSRVKNGDLVKAKEKVSSIIIDRMGIHRAQTVIKNSILVCVYLFMMATLMHKK